MTERFALGHKKLKGSEKLTKYTNFFQQIACFLRVIRSNHEQITHVAFFTEPQPLTRAIRSQSLFCKERQKRFAHCHTFLKSDESDSLTVALF